VQASAIPSINEPLTADRQQELNAVVADFSHEQLLWSSGYLAGLAASSNVVAAAPAPRAETEASTWTILYATETGNSRRVAEMLAGQGRDAGLAVEVHDLRNYKPRSLTRVTQALFVIATHGIGEAPDGSELFFEYWLGENAPRLEQLTYSVLALGDSSYADFCEMGVRLDQQLRSLGATALTERVDCDLDFDGTAATWAGQVVAKALERTPSAPTRPAHLRAVSASPVYSRQNPYPAEVLVRQPITGPASSKSVCHVELDIEGSGLDYLPGDSLGVVSRNPEALVEALLVATRLDADDPVTLDGASIPLAQALRDRKEITALSRPFLQQVSTDHPSLDTVLADRDALARYFKTHQLIDVVSEHPRDWAAQAFADALRGLTPRLYSIASSPLANPGEAHLTVGKVAYHAWGREHWGSASTYLADGPDQVPVYIERNDHFRLPDDGDTPIIMIGAGTGVAPYRAFIEHRAALGHRGDNWLIFGDRHFASDFLYQLEWLRYRKEGLLARLDVAFSRDQLQKHYVQHLVLEQAREVRRWLERGAHVYVCGDADYMAVDVHKALQTVLEKDSGLSPAEAAAELSALKQAGRYQRDVY